VKQQPGVVCNGQAIFSAAANGHTAMCEYLRAEGLPWTSSACFFAAHRGHSDTLRWLRERGCSGSWDIRTLSTAAAMGGSVDVLRYLHQQGLGFDAARLTELLGTAGTSDKLAAAQWLRQQGADWPDVLNKDRVQDMVGRCVSLGKS
jgi:hypothetical protein